MTEKDSYSSLGQAIRKHMIRRCHLQQVEIVIKRSATASSPSATSTFHDRVNKIRYIVKLKLPSSPFSIIKFRINVIHLIYQ